MLYKSLGKSDLNISSLGFGAWQAGGGDWTFALGPQDDRDSIAAIHRAVELGINWIDTAPLYGLGHSEEVVAKALDGLADRPYIFTKCGMPWDENGRIFHSLRRESIKRECESSLRRLRVETIDLYQIHWNKPAEEVEEALETLVELRDEGKIRHVGVSNFNLDELDGARRIADPISLQPPYSLIDREVEGEILPFCAAHEIGVIVYSPMASGLLSGKMTRERIASFPADDLRSSRPEFQEPELSRHLELAERLKVVGEKYGVSAAEVAVAWTLDNPAVTGAIVGLRRVDQVDGIIKASELALAADDFNYLTMDERSVTRASESLA